MELNLTAILAGVAIANFLLTVLQAFSLRSRATRESIDRVERITLERLSVIEARVAAMEKEIQHMPDHDDIGKIYERIKEVANSQTELAKIQSQHTGTLTAIAEQVRTLVTFLTQEGLRKQ